MSVVTWGGHGASSAVALAEKHATPSFAPVFSLWGHTAPINNVSFYAPPASLLEGGASGVFAAPAAVSCDSDGCVWVWDLLCRRAHFSFRPLEVARTIKKRRIAAAVDAHVAALEADPSRHSSPLSPSELAAAIAAKTAELADADLRLLPTDAMSGVLSASIIVANGRVVTSSAPSDGDVDDDEEDVVALPLIVTQCRNQSIHFWAIRELEGGDGSEDAEGGGGAAFSSAVGADEVLVAPNAALRLVHEVRVGQLGFCNALVWVGPAPRSVVSLGALAGEEAASEDGSDESPQSIFVASPGDNDGSFVIHRFSLALHIHPAEGGNADGAEDKEEGSVSLVAHVESSATVTVANFKCGQAMCASLFECNSSSVFDAFGASDASPLRRAAPPLFLLVVGYESGHAAVFDTAAMATLAAPRVAPDPVTACRVIGLDLASGGLVAVVGSAEGMLRRVLLPVPMGGDGGGALSAMLSALRAPSDADKNGCATRRTRTAAADGWSHKAPQGLGAVACDARAGLVAVAGWDGQVRLLDAAAGTVVTNLVHHKGSVAVVAAFEGGFGGGGHHAAARFAASLASNLPRNSSAWAVPSQVAARVHTCALATAGADREIAVWAVHREL